MGKHKIGDAKQKSSGPSTVGIRPPILASDQLENVVMISLSLKPCFPTMLKCKKKKLFLQLLKSFAVTGEVLQ